MVFYRICWFFISVKILLKISGFSKIWLKISWYDTKISIWICRISKQFDPKIFLWHEISYYDLKVYSRLKIQQVTRFGSKNSNSTQKIQFFNLIKIFCFGLKKCILNTGWGFFEKILKYTNFFLKLGNSCQISQAYECYCGIFF